MSFVDTYQWACVTGDSRRLVERYLDAFLYLANWGTRELIVRLPTYFYVWSTANCDEEHVGRATAVELRDRARASRTTRNRRRPGC